MIRIAGYRPGKTAARIFLSWLNSSAEPFQVRVQRVRTPRQLHTIEGGFAAARQGDIALPVDQDSGRALAETDADLTAIVDLGST